MYIQVCTYSNITGVLHNKLLKKRYQRYNTGGKAQNILKSSLFILMLFFFSPQFLYAQENTFEEQEPEKDSLLVYKKIKKAAYKYKVTQWAYDLMFVDPEPKEYPVQPASKEVKNVNP